MGNHLRQDFKTSESEECLERICRMKHTLVKHLCQELCDGDMSSADTAETGQIIDMIKDLSASERYCAQAEYYTTVTDAMDDATYRMGYTPDPEMMRSMDGHMWKPERRGRHHEGRDMAWDGDDPKYSKAYNRYRNAKRHYTETHNESDRQMMREQANEHILESIATLRDIWDNADVDLKTRMKADLTKLISDME